MTDATERVEVFTESAVNTIGMNITIHTVKLDGITIGEFREEKWAALFADAVTKLPA